MPDAPPTRVALCGAAEIAAGLASGRPIRVVFVRAGPLPAESREVLHACEMREIPVRKAGPREMDRLSPAGRPQELLALAGPDPRAGLPELLASRGALWLLVDVAYPGNVGFAIRTAEVSGAAGIVIDAGFDHAGRRQATRAGMRADRVFPVHFARAEELLAPAREAGYRILGIEDRGVRAPWEADLTGPRVLVVGGEARGIPRAVLDACDDVLRIPMSGFIPSYNLQAAVAIVAGERLRQLAAARD